MSGAKELPQGLKAHAQATLFADLRVTPAMQERLRRRIRELPAAEAAPKRSRVWLSRGYAAAAVAACALIIGQAALQQFPAGPVPAESGQLGERGAQVPPPPVSKQTDAPPAVLNLTPGTMTVQLYDTNGSKVNFTSSSAIIATAADEAGNNMGPAPATPGVEVQPGRKVVLNAEYHLRVADARTAAADLQRLALGAGGYVVEANLNQGGDGSWAGRVILRIPAARYGESAAQVAGLGEVRQQRQWSQDVTDEYLDAERRIAILAEFETKLQELASQAANFEDWLKLTRQINETRAEIERLQGNLKQLANQVDFSTITVTLEQPAVPAPAPSDAPPSIWSDMGRSFRGSLTTLGEFGHSLMLGLAGALPYLALALVAGGGTVVITRRVRRRGAPKSEEP